MYGVRSALPPRYVRVSTASAKPAGWALDQVRVQVDRSTFFRNTQALGDVKRLLPNAPAQHLTAVRILTLLAHFWYLLLLTYVWQADNYTQDNTLLLTFTWQPAIDASTLTFKTHLKPSSRRMRANYHFKSGEQGVSLS